MNKYRFRTEDELFRDYGESWKKKGSCMLPCMSPIMGQPLLPVDCKLFEKALKVKNDKLNPEGYHGFFLKGNYKTPAGNFKDWFMDETGIVKIEE